MGKILEVKDLRINFYTRYGKVSAVDGITFHINKGECVGLVGESGCGKSVTALSIMQLVPVPPAKIESGEIWLENENLMKKSERELREIRGNLVSMIFQDHMTSLNPVYNIGRQICESLELHRGLTRKRGMEKAVELLKLVRIPCPESRAREYPHQMSGGMRQRVMIAMALACNPKLLIADEPTTALDVTTQAQILDILSNIRESTGMAILMITHDLGVIAQMADRVIVMYAGKIVEEGPVKKLFSDPKHPYTQGLLASMLVLSASKERLHEIKGSVPRFDELPTGCCFHPRCEYMQEICSSREPPLINVEGGQIVRCWKNVK